MWIDLYTTEWFFAVPQRAPDVFLGPPKKLAIVGIDVYQRCTNQFIQELAIDHRD